MSFKIKKITGEMEEFDLEKLKRSLIAPGTSHELAEKIVKHIQNNLLNFKSSEDIYRFALDQLREKEPHIAARYALKRSLLEFGPTGFPFEQFISAIFKAQGYETVTNQIVSGWCVDHEIDAIVKKDNNNFMVECKFHNELGLRTHVQVTLYTDARFYDIKKTWSPDNGKDRLTHTWVVTNTKFTDEAIKYANCKSMNLTSWDYPKENNLAQIIMRYNLYPITVIKALSHAQKGLLIQNGLVLAKDIVQKKEILKKLGFKDSEIENITKTCSLICGI